MFRTHLAFSLLIALLIITFFNIQDKIYFMIILVLASSFPDIDSDKSKIGRRFPIFSKLINLFFGHRGIFHSIFPPLILLFTFWYFDLFYIGLAIFIGYLTHLIADSITLEGINFLYPFSSFRIKGLIRTGSLVESLLFLMLIIINSLFIYKLY